MAMLTFKWIINNGGLKGKKQNLKKDINNSVVKTKFNYFLQKWNVAVPPSQVFFMVVLTLAMDFTKPRLIPEAGKILNRTFSCVFLQVFSRLLFTLKGLE